MTDVDDRCVYLAPAGSGSWYNRDPGRFHTSEACAERGTPWREGARTKEWFLERAVKEGYRPCGICAQGIEHEFVPADYPAGTIDEYPGVDAAPAIATDGGVEEESEVSLCKGGCGVYSGWIDECPECGAKVRTMTVKDPEEFATDGGTDQVLYLTTVECHDGHETEFAHRGPDCPIDQSPPSPDVTYCPKCGEPYPGDLGAATTEVANAERVDPELVTDGGRVESDSGVHRPPKVYDHVEAPDGHVCQRLVHDGDGHHEPCLADAEVIVVYEGSQRPEDDSRKNVLTCRECAPPITEDEREIATDGGRGDAEGVDSVVEREIDVDAYEEKRDELYDGLETAYAAGFARAKEVYDIDSGPSDHRTLKKTQGVAENHYYFWEGRTLPLEFWLRSQFEIGSDDDQGVEHSDDLESDVGPAETFLADVDTVPDATEATRRFNSILNELRKRTHDAKFRVVIVEVDDDE